MNISPKHSSTPCLCYSSSLQCDFSYKIVIVRAFFLRKHFQSLLCMTGIRWQLPADFMDPFPYPRQALQYVPNKSAITSEPGSTFNLSREAVKGEMALESKGCWSPNHGNSTAQGGKLSPSKGRVCTLPAARKKKATNKGGDGFRSLPAFTLTSLVLNARSAFLGNLLIALPASTFTPYCNGEQLFKNTHQARRGGTHL